MSVVSYEVQFHALSRNASELLTFEEERIYLYIKDLKNDLHVLSGHMNFTEKRFNEFLNYVKKLERVTQVGQAKIFAKKSQNFRGSYSKGHDQQSYSGLPIHSAWPNFTIILSFFLEIIS